jgi:hypothetical protein
MGCLGIQLKARMVALGLCALAATAGPRAKADVIFNLVQTSAPVRYDLDRGVVPGPLVFNSVMVVSDDAYANGFTFSHRGANSGPPFSNLEGLESFTTTILLDGSPSLVVTLPDFLRVTAPGSGFFNSIAMTFSPGSGLSGDFAYNNSESDFRVSLAGTLFSGEVRSDGSLPCFWGACPVSGMILVTQPPDGSSSATVVPEPSSLSLAAIGGIALAAARRRRPRRRTA